MRIQNPGIELDVREVITTGFIRPVHPRPISFSASALVVYSYLKTIALSVENDIPMQDFVGNANIKMSESFMRQVSR